MGITRIPLDITEVLEEPTFDEMVEFIKTIASIGIAQDKLRFVLANALSKVFEKFPDTLVNGLLVGVETYELLLPLTGQSGQFMGYPLTPSKEVAEGEVQVVVAFSEGKE